MNFLKNYTRIIKKKVHMKKLLIEDIKNDNNKIWKH
jgi:hypothetical protein